MPGEAAGHMLQPTALVREACLRLIKAKSPSWENRAQFFSAATEAMRRVLILACNPPSPESSNGDGPFAFPVLRTVSSLA